MLQRLLTFFKRRSQPTEEDTEYNGFLSYSAEWHALSIGLSVGVSSAVLETPEIAATVVFASIGVKGSGEVKEQYSEGVVSELRREAWYSTGGVLVGYGVGLLGGSFGLL